MSQTVREIAERLLDGIVLLGLHYDTQMAEDVKALAGHVLASTEPLGDDLDSKLREMVTLQECWPETVQEARKSIADLRAQLQAATMRAEAAEGDTRMMDELQAKCGALLMEVERLKVAESFAWNSGHAKFLDAQQLAYERGREVERLRSALERCRQGQRNILEFRKLESGRYGALTREEIETVIAEIDVALATPAATPPAHHIADSNKMAPPAQEHPDTATCKRCNGKTTIDKHDGGRHYETDSDDEHDDHWYKIPCPDCTAPEAQR